MADNALKRLARLLGGVALTQGRLPHQVLGQLMITNATSVEIAGANVVVAATSRMRGAVAQVALRTAAPALAVQALVQRQEKRLRRLADQAQDRERSVGLALQRVRTERLQQDQRVVELQRVQARLDARACDMDEQTRRLETRESEIREQTAQLDALARQLEARTVTLAERSCRLDARETELAQREVRLRVPSVEPTPAIEPPSSAQASPADASPPAADESTDAAGASGSRPSLRSRKKKATSTKKSSRRSSPRDPSGGRGSGGRSG
jgi:hypothetical protein